MAKKLSEKLNIPAYCTDDFYWAVKYSKPHDKKEASASILAVYNTDQWIVEGTTQWLLTPGFNLADTIIYLNYRNIFQQWFTIIKRYVTKGDQGNLRETLWLLRHVFYKRYSLSYKKGKPTHLEVIDPYKDKMVTLSSFEEIDNFLFKN
ncbi:MAG: hypothetical protein RLZZ469_1261 [Bacteroidota bacterium]|jgi:adenylate kinase family enzyme